MKLDDLIKRLQDVRGVIGNVEVLLARDLVPGAEFLVHPCMHGLSGGRCNCPTYLVEVIDQYSFDPNAWELKRAFHPECGHPMSHTMLCTEVLCDNHRRTYAQVKKEDVQVKKDNACYHPEVNNLGNCADAFCPNYAGH